MDPALAVELAAISRRKALLSSVDGCHSDIQQFYEGTNLFLTGASGFMGKQMTEKLLRSCKLSKLYILMRPKKGKSVQERLQYILEDPVFEPVRQQNPSFKDMIVPIEGDASLIRLGISDDDWTMLTKEVNIVYHMAATTRFDEELKSATLINVRGTREVIELCKACTNLKSFVHISSSYAHALEQLIRSDVHEKFYGSVIPPQTLIDMAENMDEERLKSLTEPLIRGWPNTYTFTKAVSEDLIRTNTVGLPASIVRPGIVVNTYKEPLPGWQDISCAFGASGIFIGVGLGVLHCVLSYDHTRLGLVPCDYVNNAIIAAGKETLSSSGGEDTKIYVVNSTARNPLHFYILPLQTASDLRKYISPVVLYYPFLFLTPYKLVYDLTTILSQLIPAYIADFVLSVLGKPRRFVKLCTKVNKLAHMLSYFTLNDWNFRDENLVELYDKQSKTDKILFNFDLTDYDWIDFTVFWGLGIRRYIIKDGLHETEKGTRKIKWLRILHYIVCALYLYLFWKIISVSYGIIRYVF